MEPLLDTCQQDENYVQPGIFDRKPPREERNRGQTREKSSKSNFGPPAVFFALSEASTDRVNYLSYPP